MSAPVTLDAIVGDSPAIRDLRDLVRRAGPADLPVLVHGPTGAGKDLVAQALHALSRRSGSFVAVNVCAVPEAMFEDALFGHVRGAFTGATSDARGYILEANGGSLFLDEIGALPHQLQAKLLRVLETGEFRPIGAGADRRSDFRVVTATNEAIPDLVAAGRFRADLAHRIQGVVLHVPALSDRLEDLDLLVRHFARQATGAGQPCTFTDSALRVLRDHDWPGNVRELRHVIHRAMALSGRTRLTGDDIRPVLLPHAPPPIQRAVATARQRLTALLEKHDWNTARVAEELDVHRATVYRRMRRLGIAGDLLPSAFGGQAGARRQ